MNLLSCCRLYFLVMEDSNHVMCIKCCCLCVWLDVGMDCYICASMRECTSCKAMTSGGDVIMVS